MAFRDKYERKEGAPRAFKSAIDALMASGGSLGTDGLGGRTVGLADVGGPGWGKEGTLTM